MRPLLLLFVAFGFMSVGHAESDVTPDQDRAIKDTQTLLRNPESRKKIMNENADTKGADQRVRALGGTEKQNQEIYELAADIFGSVAHDAKGDPDQMEKALEKALADPEGFANSFTPEQRKKLKDIASELEKGKNLP